MTKAAPTRLQSEDPLLFTVRISAEGPVRGAPQRPDLREWPTFSESFYVEDRTDQDTADDQTWEFVYQLRPRSSAIQAVPSFPLVYYQPGMLPAARGYMTRWAPAIPLDVRPREEVQPSEVTGDLALQLPETVYQFITDPAVLTRRESAPLPSAPVLGLLLLAPPLLCLCWYLTWRRIYPDAVQRARQRRSRASELALKKLKPVRRLTGREQAEAAVAIVANYLHQRFDCPDGEPTPREIAVRLRQAGFAEALAEQAAHFVQDCDMARFLPAPSQTGDLHAAAVKLILALEERPWPA
jgi:hypothetical protein